MRDHHETAGAQRGDQCGAVDGARRLRVGDVEQRHEDQRFGNDVRPVGEILHADGCTGLRGARRQPAHQHEGAENQEPVEAEHEARDLSGEPRFEQTQFDENESEDATDHMGVGARDEFSSAIDAGAGKSRVIAWEIGHRRPPISWAYFSTPQGKAPIQPGCSRYMGRQPPFNGP